MAKQAAPEAAGKWLALAQLEARVASRLAETLSERGQPIPMPNDVARRARERCEVVAGKSWAETMQWLRALAGDALQRMRTEADQLPEPLDAIGDLVVRHEAALLEFADMELAGNGMQSLHAVTLLLDSHAQPALSSGELLGAMQNFKGKGAGPRRKAR
jgi:hypothetical protein